MSVPHGDGPGDIARDGSAVEVYSRLPPGDDPALLHAHLPPGAHVLDLGAGTGRLADALTNLGHHVLAVDDSPAMLARVQHADTITSRIEDLHLPGRFDAVLLASHLINTPSADDRHGLLGAIERHLRRDGRAFIEWHPPTWFDGLDPTSSYTGRVGDLVTTLIVHSLEADLLSATVTYQDPEAAGPHAEWAHTFTARRLTLDQLKSEAADAGLGPLDTLPGAEQWLHTSRATALDQQEPPPIPG